MRTSSIIEFSLLESNEVSISITDSAGRTIREVMSGFLNSGSHSVMLNLLDLTNGLYFLLIESGNDSRMIKLSVEE